MTAFLVVKKKRINVGFPTQVRVSCTTLVPLKWLVYGEDIFWKSLTRVGSSTTQNMPTIAYKKLPKKIVRSPTWTEE